MSRREIIAEAGRVLVVVAFLLVTIMATGCSGVRWWLSQAPVTTPEQRMAHDVETLARIERLRELRRIHR